MMWRHELYVFQKFNIQWWRNHTKPTDLKSVGNMPSIEMIFKIAVTCMHLLFNRGHTLFSKFEIREYLATIVSPLVSLRAEGPSPPARWIWTAVSPKRRGHGTSMEWKSHGRFNMLWNWTSRVGTTCGQVKFKRRWLTWELSSTFWKVLKKCR